MPANDNKPLAGHWRKPDLPTTAMRLRENHWRLEPANKVFSLAHRWRTCGYFVPTEESMNDTCIDRLDAPAPQPDLAPGPDDEPVVDEAKAQAFRRRLARAEGMSVADAARAHIRTQRKRLAAEHLAAAGDHLGARLELAEAADLQTVADLAIDPTVHSTGRVVVGAGGEAVLGNRSQFANTVRERPDMIALDASQKRLELADAAGALELGIDFATSVQAGNSLEKALSHQMAATHRLGMEMMAQAAQLLQRFDGSGHVALSVESARLATCASKLMLAFQGGMATIARLRGGGQQVVTVQHVVVGEGGQAVVAGQVKARSKRRKGEG
jgi:hypothetical protein